MLKIFSILAFKLFAYAHFFIEQIPIKVVDLAVLCVLIYILSTRKFN